MELVFTPTDVIQIIGIFASLITSIVAIAISVKTLKQNSKMIEESTRPYINLYIGSTYFSDTITYLIIKNFGTSSAIITSFESEVDFKTCSYDESHIPFEHIVGTNLCPNESLQFPVKSYELSRLSTTFYVNISYKSEVHSYNEVISINFAAYCDRLHLRANTKDKHDKEISFALQDIAEKML